MATRNPRPDPKQAALAETRCLNPHPEQVRDEAFLASEFFDARDLVQVKYEMVRRVKAEGASVTSAAAAFGYSRPSYYEAASARSMLRGCARTPKACSIGPASAAGRSPGSPRSCPSAQAQMSSVSLCPPRGPGLAGTSPSRPERCSAAAAS